MVRREVMLPLRTTPLVEGVIRTQDSNRILRETTIYYEDTLQMMHRYMERDLKFSGR